MTTLKAKRNTDGLRQNAQKKRQESFDKVEQGIQRLIKEKGRINFNTVAAASGVSKAWLYKEPTVKARIEHLRQQSTGKTQQPVKQRASDDSKNAVIRTLKERIKKLETENRDLRKQNEVAYGHVLRVHELEAEVARLKAGNERLHRCARSSSVVEMAPVGIEQRLADLGVSMNSTLERLVRETPSGIVQTAVEALQESSRAGQVRNPGGFLNRAISASWRPNGDPQSEAELQDFNEWWPEAYREGLVTAATQIEGVQYVLTADEEWVPFEEVGPLGNK